MELRKKFSPFEALAYGARTFIDQIRLFTLSTLVVAGFGILLSLALALLNIGFIKSIVAIVSSHFEQIAQAHAADATNAAATPSTFVMELMFAAADHMVTLSISVVLLFFAAAGIVAGYSGLYLELYDTGASKPTRVLSFMKKSLTIFLATGMAFVATVAGLVLFIVPGIYVGLRLSLTSLFIVDKNVGPIASLRASWAATQGHVWQLAALTFVQLLLAKFVGIGIFLGFIPALAYVYAYRKLTA